MSIECPVYVELERRTNAPVLTDKLQRYSGHWLRLLESCGRFELRPIVVVQFDTRPAKRRRKGSGAMKLRENVGDLLYPPKTREDDHTDGIGDPTGHFAVLQETLRKMDEHGEHADPGRMILMCSWEEMLREGPYKSDYYPVGGYPADEEEGVYEEGWTIDLSAAARERAAMIGAFEGVAREKGR